MSCYSLPGTHSFVSGSWSAFWSTQKSNIKNKTAFQLRIKQTGKQNSKASLTAEAAEFIWQVFSLSYPQSDPTLASLKSPVHLKVSDAA